MIGGRGGRAKREIISRGDWILKEGNPGLPTVQKRFPAYIKKTWMSFLIFFVSMLWTEMYAKKILRILFQVSFLEAIFLPNDKVVP